MIIGIPVYNGVDLLDVTGPYEIFQWINKSENFIKSKKRKIEVRIIAQRAGEITSRDGFTFRAHANFEHVTKLDVLWTPGGDIDALKNLMDGADRSYLDFLVAMAKKARFVASVCEGALLLAAAGLLDGYEATTHWAFIPCLKQFPKIKIAEGHPRFVVDRDRITGGGISSGLDEALKLVELLTSYDVAQDVQRVTQYYPDPPVASSLPPVDQCPFRW
jgi:cyclohexyl-isocyanide hydratase